MIFIPCCYSDDLPYDPVLSMMRMIDYDDREKERLDRREKSDKEIGIKKTIEKKSDGK